MNRRQRLKIEAEIMAGRVETVFLIGIFVILFAGHTSQFVLGVALTVFALYHRIKLSETIRNLETPLDADHS